MSACVAPIYATVWTGRDNRLTLILFRDGELLTDLSGVTRITVDLGGSTTPIDSETATAGVVTWTETSTWRGTTTDVVRLKLGGLGVAAGEYTGVEVVIYDATYPNGLRMETALKVTVV